MSDPRLLFMFWGRRGAIAHLTQEIGRVIAARPGPTLALSASRQMEHAGSFGALGDRFIPVRTFAHGSGALFQAWRIPALRRRLRDEIRTRRIDTVIDLMPHVWSPFVISAVRAAGSRYIAIAHDAVAHPGDHTALVKAVLDRAVVGADQVIVLSDSVRKGLETQGHVPASRISRAFLPDFSYGASRREAYRPGRPLRLLFLGRIMAYKGLPLLVRAMQILRREGISTRCV